MTTENVTTKDIRAQETALARLKVQHGRQVVGAIERRAMTAAKDLRGLDGDYRYSSMPREEKIKLLIKMDTAFGRVALMVAWQLGALLLSQKEYTRDNGRSFVAYIKDTLRWEYRRAARYMKLARTFRLHQDIDKLRSIGADSVSAALEVARLIDQKKLREKTRFGPGPILWREVAANVNIAEYNPDSYDDTDDKDGIAAYRDRGKLPVEETTNEDEESPAQSPDSPSQPQTAAPTTTTSDAEDDNAPEVNLPNLAHNLDLFAEQLEYSLPILEDDTYDLSTLPDSIRRLQTALARLLTLASGAPRTIDEDAPRGIDMRDDNDA